MDFTQPDPPQFRLESAPIGMFRWVSTIIGAKSGRIVSPSGWIRTGSLRIRADPMNCNPGGIRGGLGNEPGQQRARPDPGGFSGGFRSESGRIPGRIKSRADPNQTGADSGRISGEIAGA